MSHHLVALQFLTKPEILKRDLTVGDILEVHRIVMENSIGYIHMTRSNTILSSRIEPIGFSSHCGVDKFGRAQK
jgi:hypothetical protein